MSVADWEKSLTEGGDRWWTERPERYTWGALMRLAAGQALRPLALKRPDSLAVDDPVHPLVVRAMMAPAYLGEALASLPWAVLNQKQAVSPSSTSFVHTVTVMDLVLARADDQAVQQLAQRVLDDAANVFNDPTFRFVDKDLPIDGRSRLPSSLGESHRPAWAALQNQRVRRSFFNLVEHLGEGPAPDAATVVRWQRWATMLSCTTYSQAEANVVQALVQHGHPVPIRTVTAGSVLKNVPDMPVGFFASLVAQGIDLATCTGFYEQGKNNGKWKRVPPEAASRLNGNRVLQFNLLDLAALRGRQDLVDWALDQGLRPSEALVEPLMALLRETLALHPSGTGRYHQAAQRMANVEGMFLRAAHADAMPSSLEAPVIVARRRL